MLADEDLVIQPIFEHHRLKVGTVYEFDVDVGVKLLQPAQLTVLFGDEPLLHGG